MRALSLSCSKVVGETSKALHTGNPNLRCAERLHCRSVEDQGPLEGLFCMGKGFQGPGAFAESFKDRGSLQNCCRAEFFQRSCLETS